MSEKHTPEELEHTRVMAQAMRATTPEQRRELDMLLYGSNPPLDVLLAAPELLEATLEGMYWLESPAVHDALRGDPAHYAALERAIIAIRAAVAKAKPDA